MTALILNLDTVNLSDEIEILWGSTAVDPYTVCVA